MHLEIVYQHRHIKRSGSEIVGVRHIGRGGENDRSRRWPGDDEIDALFRAADERDELRKQVELLRAGMANALDQRDALERK